MQVSKSGSGTFEQAPKGTYQGVCVDVTDEGMQPNIFKEGNPLEPKISIVFVLDKLKEDGRPYIISRWLTLSLHEKSKLSEFLCNWHDASYAELPNDFDLEELIGRNARIRVIQKPKKTKPEEIRAEIASIEPWEGDNLPIPSDYTRKQDRESNGYEEEPPTAAANKFRPNAEPVKPARFMPDATEAPERVSRLVPEAMRARQEAAKPPANKHDFDAAQKRAQDAMSKAKEAPALADDEVDPFADSD